MRKLRLFKCSECSKTQERLVNDDQLVVECIECKQIAVRKISAGKYLGNTTGKSPSI